MCDVPHAARRWVQARADVQGATGRFVPIILLTALDDLDSKRRGLAAGADEFLDEARQHAGASDTRLVDAPHQAPGRRARDGERAV